MGCASSQSGGLPDNTGPDKALDNSNPTATAADNELSAKYPPAEAFEIPLDDIHNDNDDGSDSLIKKHPPKRLQKLVEQAATAVPPTTIEQLEEKLAKAEVRRQQYIQQRIENIATLTGKGGGGGGVSGNGDADGDGCKVKDNDQNDSQNDEHNDGGNGNVDGAASSTDAGVVQSTMSNESADERTQIDGDHNADNRTHA